MLFPGFVKNKYGINIIAKRNAFSRKKLYKSSLPSGNKYHLFNYNMSFHLPKGWDFLLISSPSLNKRVFYTYSSSYFFRFSIPLFIKSLHYDPNTSLITFNSLFINNFFRIYWGNLLLIFSVLNRPFFKKIKFKGKGYYIYKNSRNTITPQFGYAHRIYIYSFFLNVKFLSKVSILVFGFSKNDIADIIHSIKSTRPINIFTGRGVRFSREIIYKKQGKVSSYR